MFVLSGCEDGNFFPVRTEISQFGLVRSIGIDKGSQPGLIKMSIIFKQESQGGGEGGGDSGGGGSSGGGGKSGNALILAAEADTVNTAARKFQEYLGRQVYFAHALSLLVGKDAASEDIVKYLDFISREQETRLDLLVYLVEGNAEEVFQNSTTSPYFFTERVKNISESVELVSISKKMPLYNLMAELDENKTFALAVPAIRLVERKDPKGKSSKDLEVNGYGIVKDYKLIGFIHGTTARAYNFITNQIKTGSVDVKDPSGQLVSLELLGSSTKITPIVKDNQLQGVILKTKLESNINEMQGRDNIFNQNAIHELEDNQSQAVKEQMEQCIKFAQENRADFLGIGSRINMKNPVLFEGIKDQWSNLFSTLKINVEVESKINRSYDLLLPNGYKKEETKK